MKFRPLLYLTALLSAALGATGAYLALSVPNDLRADAMLKEARGYIAAGNTAQARESLSKVVQQYPRTDAAAAATLALLSLGQKERNELAHAVAQLRAQNAEQTRLLSVLQKGLAQTRTQPPEPVTVEAPKPAPPPAAKKTPPKKKKTTKTTKRRR